MSYEYGSTEFVVRNPFRLEGVLTALGGVIIAGLGIYLLVGVRAQVDAGLQPVALTHASVGVVMTAWGLIRLGRGAWWAFRFFVGRGVPAGLAAERRTDRTDPGAHRYSDEELAAMLMGRKNLSFKEPDGWLDRALHSLAPQFLFMPPQLYLTSATVIAATIYSLIYFLSFGLAASSGLMGLTPITETPIVDWLGWLTVIVVTAVWIRHRPRRNPSPASAVGTISGLKLALLAGVAIVVPGILVRIHMQSPLPEVVVSPMPALVTSLVLTLVSGAAAAIMLVLRSPGRPPRTEVSEYRDHWQESAHPMDIFRAFDMAMADHRVLEMPNRTYRVVDPNLIVRDDKGAFYGDVLSEVQPIPTNQTPVSPNLRLAWILGVVVSLICTLGSSWILFRTTIGIDSGPNITNIDSFVLAGLLLLFGGIIGLLAHRFSSEVFFESQMVQLIANGTFTESNVTTGGSIFDSNRSENKLIRSSITPWMLCAKTLSSTLAVGGPYNLEQPRFVHSFEPDEQLLETLAKSIKSFLSGRELIASISSEADLRVAANMHAINEQTRAPLPELGGGGTRPTATDRQLSESGSDPEGPTTRLPGQTPEAGSST